MTFRVETIPDAEWAPTVAKRLGAAAARGLNLCLATGATVAPAYELIDDLDGSVVYLLDEFGGLPVDDDARCSSMLQRTLLSHLVSDCVVHVPDVDTEDVAAAAERYASLIGEAGIDLAVVGLGLNGHVGMNEPGSGVDQCTRVVELAPSTSHTASTYGAAYEPTWGITVGMAELMAAGEVWLVVTGSRKASILSEVLTSDQGPHLPATFLRDHPNCTVLADVSASGPGGLTTWGPKGTGTGRG